MSAIVGNSLVIALYITPAADITVCLPEDFMYKTSLSVGAVTFLATLPGPQLFSIFYLSRYYELRAILSIAA